MKRDCREIDNLIPDFAEGREVPGLAEHLRTCPECSRKLDHYRVMLSAARRGVHDAPKDLVARAKALLRTDRVLIHAKLLGSSIELARARSATSDFQLVVGDKDYKIRLLYARRGGQWEVTGRAPGPGWHVAQAAGVRDCDGEGGFVVRAPNLGGTGFLLIGVREEITIPSAQDLLDVHSR